MRARARTSPPSGSGRLAIATVPALSVDDTATCSNARPIASSYTSALYDSPRTRGSIVAPSRWTRRGAAALNASQASRCRYRPTCPMSRRPQAAQARSPASPYWRRLTAAAVPPAVPGPHRLDVLPGADVDQGARARTARRSAGGRRRTGWSAPPRRASSARPVAAPTSRSVQPGRRELVGAADDRERGLVDGDRPPVADRPERCPVAARDAEPPALRGVALPDPLREPAAVGLGLDRLPRPALPLVLVGAEGPARRRTGSPRPGRGGRGGR